MMKIVTLALLGLVIYTEGCSYSPPSFIVQPPNDVIYQVSDEKFEMKCEAEGEPASQYYWKKNGAIVNNSVDNSIGTLNVENSPDLHQQKYQCFAENSFGIAASNIVTVEKIEVGQSEYKIANATENLPFKLDCSLSKMAKKYRINWLIVKESEKNITSVNSTHLVTDPEGTLWFLNVQKTDEAHDFYYTCSVTLSTRIIYGHKILLKVNTTDSPTPSDVKLLHSSTNDTIGLLKNEVKLFCIFGGSSVATVDWKKGTENLNHNSSIISIKNVGYHDEEVYTCYVSSLNGNATNATNATLSYKIKLTVKETPTFSMEPESSYYEKVGGQVTFDCEAQGNPKPEITWTFNGQNLNGTEITKFADTLYNVAKQSYTVKSITRENMGNYGCLAKNDVGYVYKDFFLNTLEVEPKITNNSKNITVTQGDKLELFCKACGVPKPEISWFKNGVDLEVKNEKYSIEKVNSTSSGEFVCKATNKIGDTNETITVVVKPTTTNSSSVEEDTEKLNNSSSGYIIVLFIVGMLILLALLIIFVEKKSNNDGDGNDAEAHNMKDISPNENQGNEKTDTQRQVDLTVASSSKLDEVKEKKSVKINEKTDTDPQENKKLEAVKEEKLDEAADQDNQKNRETQNETKQSETNTKGNVSELKDSPIDDQSKNNDETLKQKEETVPEIKIEEVKESAENNVGEENKNEKE